MGYTKEILKEWGENLKQEEGDRYSTGSVLLGYASAWAQEVAELEKDKKELLELCRLKDREGASFIDDDPLPDSDYDRMGELWAKHMKGGEG